jgi:hypothetical protein
MPFTRIRPAEIQLRASVREPKPALENTLSKVFMMFFGFCLLARAIFAFCL